MRRPSPPLLAALLAVSFVLVTAAGAARAETPAGLAPPRPCAEPREALAGGGLMGSALAAVGPLSSLFAPSDVAAPPAAVERAAPAAGGVTRPGACDGPAIACGASPLPNNPPVVPGGRPNDGTPIKGGADKPGTQPSPRPKSKPHSAPGSRPVPPRDPKPPRSAPHPKP